MTSERWILTTAWALIATAGAAGLHRISKTPAVDPELAAQCERLRTEMNGPGDPQGPEKGDAYLTRLSDQWRFLAKGQRPHALAAYFGPKGVETTLPPLVKDVPAQPWAATPAAKASLAGVELTWTLAKGPVTLGQYERAKEVAPSGLRIERREGAEWRELARLEAKARSWKDTEAAPRTTYAYRVKLDAPEGAKRAADGPEAEARTPSDRRARLMGGDAKVAILRVETFDRKSGNWVGRDATVRPGEELWPGGWRLTGLAFRGFGLVATAVDEDGRARELTTRE